MECPYCSIELNYNDYYGLGNPFSTGFKKQGDIHRCENEECEVYMEHFYTRNNWDELFEGYPC
jgi:hypothetical protein